MILELLIFLGQESEVLALDFDDVDFGKNTITIRKEKAINKELFH